MKSILRWCDEAEAVDTRYWSSPRGSFKRPKEQILALPKLLIIYDYYLRLMADHEIIRFGDMISAEMK